MIWFLDLLEIGNFNFVFFIIESLKKFLTYIIKIFNLYYLKFNLKFYF